MIIERRPLRLGNYYVIKLPKIYNALWEIISRDKNAKLVISINLPEKYRDLLYEILESEI